MIGSMLALALQLQEAPDLLSDGTVRPQIEVPVLEGHGGEWGIELDAVLSEPQWQQAARFSGFREVEPVEGAAADPDTEILVWRSATHLYLGVNCYEPNPEGVLLQNQHRDAFLNDDDRIEFVFDTFGSSPQAYFFQISAAGSRGDALIGDNGNRFNKRWDTYWDARTRVESDRWVAEIVIPLRSIASGDQGVWRANVKRYRAATRSESRWGSGSRSARFFNLVNGGIWTGIRDVDHGYGVTLAPYVKAKRLEVRGGESDWDFGMGGELDWWLTPQLKLSLTANTDFAETEVDDRRVNLSQYSLFFPEKRDFFLEDANLFEFGPARSTSVVPFYSRRIGLVSGSEVDVDTGARLSGRAGPWDLGLLAVRTGAARIDGDEVPAGEMFVLRPSYNVTERFAVGGILTYGDPENNSRNLVTGVDSRFNDRLWGGEFDLTGYVVRSEDEAANTKGAVAGARAALRTSDWQFTNDILLSKDEFDPGIGFVRRPGQSNWSGSAVFQPRPDDANSSIRNYIFQLRPSAWFEDGFRLMSHGVNLTWFGIEWHSGDQLELQARYSGDRVTSDSFDPGGVPVGADFYDWFDVGIEFESSEARSLAVEADLRSGTWYDGTRTRLGLELNWRPSPTMAWGIDYTENQADLDNGDFATRVLGVGASLYASPRLSWENIVQGDNESDELGWQSRLRWIHRDGQELFFVVNAGWVQREDDVIVPTERDLALKLVYSVRL